MNNYEEEITELKNKIADYEEKLAEYEAVEQYMMKLIRNGGEYGDALRAHYREGKIVDGEWKLYFIEGKVIDGVAHWFDDHDDEGEAEEEEDEEEEENK